MSRKAMLHAAVIRSRYLRFSGSGSGAVTSSASSYTGTTASSSRRNPSSSSPAVPGYGISRPRPLASSIPHGLASLGLYGAGSRFRGFAAAAASAGSDAAASPDRDVSSRIVDGGKELWGSVKAMSCQASEYTKEHVVPTLQQWLDPASPYTMQGWVPTTAALVSCAAAWLVLPRVLRRLHRYVEEGPTTGLLGRTGKHSYEMSMWAALEDPTRLFLTLVAFSQLGAVIAPSTVTGHLELAWRGGLLISGLWFLHRWKSVVFSRLLIGKASSKEEQERYLVLDKVSSVGIIALGAMALAESSGVPLQSVLTVGGIGGIATAFAARDVLGNMLSGLILQFNKPFSVGDVIAAANIEGQVTGMGLHSTTLLRADKVPMMVPNSFFSSQVILNKSRISSQSLKSQIYIRWSDMDKVPEITAQIVELLKSHPKVLSEQLCYLSGRAPSYLELTFSYETKSLNKLEVLALEQELSVRAAEVVKKLGAVLGAPA